MSEIKLFATGIAIGLGLGLLCKSSVTEPLSPLIKTEAEEVVADQEQDKNLDSASQPNGTTVNTHSSGQRPRKKSVHKSNLSDFSAAQLEFKRLKGIPPYLYYHPNNHCFHCPNNPANP